MTWVPFGAAADVHATLTDGTPDWMLNSMEQVFLTEFRTYHRASYSGGGYHTDRLDRIRRMELATRMRPRAKLVESKSVSAMFLAMTPEERLQALDWVIKDNVESSEGGNEDIEKVLRDGGSKWKVGLRNGVPGLEDRVPQGVQDAADAAMASAGDAGRLLSEAWHAVYGMNPQPDLGYRKSIEAVEAVVLPKVMPKDDSATLGKAIGQMRADGDWKLPFIKEHTQNPSQDVVLGMMQALWSGHSDRHPGTASYIQSTQTAAEAAVSVAVTLINLFGNGSIARRS